MSPRTILAWSAAALVVDLATSNPAYRALVILASLNLLVVHAPPGRALRPTLRAVAFLCGFGALLNVSLGHAGTSVLFALPDWLPLLGGPWTLESLAYGLAAGLGIGGAVLAVAPLALVLEPHELIDALPARLERSGLAVAIALNLVPGIGRTVVAIHDVERMRGWRPRGARSWGEVLVPTILTSIDESFALAEAMEARAYGTGRRTTFALPSWTGRDLVVVAGALAAVAVFVAARIVGLPMDWTAYPSLTMPRVEPILVAGCLLLALPVLPWPSRVSTD